jgi:hypothetical protein
VVLGAAIGMALAVILSALQGDRGYWAGRQLGAALILFGLVGGVVGGIVGWLIRTL